jgi:hypothetical protein
LRTLLSIVLVLVLTGCNHDRTILDRVVKLQSAEGSCSGIQVAAPSGRSYILTAGHCRRLSDAVGSIGVVREDGSTLQRAVIAEDPNSDLLLLEGLPGINGISVAASLTDGQFVRTFTHGSGFKTYRTEGQTVQESVAIAVVGEEKDCAPGMPKLTVVDVPIFFGLSVRACVLKVLEEVTTATIVPGSSGGAMVDAQGSLVGIASMSDGSFFSYFVRLQDIQTFLKAY